MALAHLYSQLCLSFFRFSCEFTQARQNGRQNQAELHFTGGYNDALMHSSFIVVRRSAAVT
jgi:hypothetical protein